MRTWWRWLAGILSYGGLGTAAWFGKSEPILIVSAILFLLVALLVVVVVLLIMWLVEDGTPGSRIDKLSVALPRAQSSSPFSAAHFSKPPG